MLTGIALALGDAPLGLVEQHGLSVHGRGGEKELRFLFRVREPLLPVWHEGQLRVVRWGCRRGESRFLPRTGWTRQARVESGWWSLAGAEPADIPASLGLDNGVWFAIREGLRGLLVADEHGVGRVFVVCQPSSHCYRIMTRSTWMPVLIGERI